MAITLGTDLASLCLIRRTGEVHEKLNRTAERLASGQRINRASDDAAGLAIAQDLSVSARLHTQASRNINDFISVLNIAGGALDSLQTVTTRMMEISKQASNGSYSTTQRQALDKEFQALRSEYKRIVSSTTFNDQQLFENRRWSIQTGITGSDAITTEILPTFMTPAGDGTFTAGATGDLNWSNALSIVVADFNGDGHQDYLAGSALIVANLFLGNGDGTFGAGIQTGLPPAAHHLAATDLNGDGYLDVAYTTYASDAVGVKFGTAGGTFVGGTTYATSGDTMELQFGDLNNDGNADIVTTTLVGPVSYYLGNGDGTFQSELTLAVPGFGGKYAVALSDFNRDGNLDIVSAGAASAGSTGTAVRVFLGNGDGTFQAQVSTVVPAAAGNGQDVKTGDFDSDGDDDIFVLNSAGELTLFENDGAGAFSVKGTPIDGIGGGGGEISVTDINKDGYSDLIVADAGSNTISTHLGNGDGTFRAVSTLVTATGQTSIGIGDFNGDASVDFVTTSYDDATSNVFLGTSVLVSQGTGAPNLLSMSVISRHSALSALTDLSSVQTRLSQSQSVLGGLMSRLHTAMAVANTQSIVAEQAAATIKDADVAEEMAAYVRQQISLQVAASLQSHTRQNRELVKTLLAPPG